MPNHYLLLYKLAPDYLERRAALRNDHLALAWDAHARGELVLGGALTDPVDEAVLLFTGDSPDVASRFRDRSVRQERARHELARSSVDDRCRRRRSYTGSSGRVSDLVHVWESDGGAITFTWLGDPDVTVDRAYAVAFDSDGRMLLVGGHDEPRPWLPGGGVEAGESEQDALRRELMEEADATITDVERIGIQLAESSDGASSYQSFSWCRITRPDTAFLPRLEVQTLHLVRPDEFLDTLFWGRTDPKAAMLLERALEIDAKHGEQI